VPEPCGRRVEVASEVSVGNGLLRPRILPHVLAVKSLEKENSFYRYLIFFVFEECIYFFFKF
jgi:hypothetical protein